jgi:propanediol dehydratase small subunit
MNKPTASLQEYPLAETRPDQVTGPRGKTLSDLTMDAALSGELSVEDIGITPQTLTRQADIARSAGRQALAENFERAAEMTRLPQAEVMRIYELLRPGRARSREVLEVAARALETEFGAPKLAAFLREAAENYERRGVFRQRF